MMLKVNFGIPHRSCSNITVRNFSISSVDVLSLILGYMKINERQISLFPIFGLVLSSVQAWIECVMEVILRVVNQKRNDQMNDKCSNET